MVPHLPSPLSSAAGDVELFTVPVSIWYNCLYRGFNLNPFHSSPLSNALTALVNIYLVIKDLSFVQPLCGAFVTAGVGANHMTSVLYLPFIYV